MPKRTDISSILLIGSGPIVIGQGCEFDYSGVQACKALREEGFRVILVNSNPATIMTDPEFADATYIEPITVEAIEKIIAKERPDALLPTLGGQTALNMAMTLSEKGILKKYGMIMIGANEEAIRKGEDRQLFKEAMLKIGLDVPLSGIAHTLDEAHEVAKTIGRFPLIIRPAFTLGGSGGGIARSQEEFEHIVAQGLDLSPVSEVLIEESLLGWKEFEMEVMRDCADNCVIICSIENFDPMGVHTGDSITVAPIQTLSDKEYQAMRDASFAVIREIGVETGGSNIQFAIHPGNGRMIVIEMNPRVSRSSALASKATGYPIAKIAAKLAVGYTLDELRNDITKETPASFEPTIDYVVTKIPRFTFEKFPDADATLTTAMKSVGEAMAIGRTFKESFQKALRSLEVGAWGLSGGKYGTDAILSREDIEKKLSVPCAERVFYLRHAFRAGMSLQTIHKLTQIDPWFLKNIEQLVQTEDQIRSQGLKTKEILLEAKQLGFSDRQLAHFSNQTETDIRKKRYHWQIIPSYRLVDTCSAEFEAYTPYYYSTYDCEEDEVRVTSKKKIMILGGGPNRIGQGIEFDYCCVHASFALKELGFETIMVNSNPETVSTDYDTSDKLFFEPLTLEDVLHIYEREKCWGVIVQFGGQTPLNLAAGLSENGVNILGTSVKDIEAAEDRQLFQQMLQKLKLKQPPNKTIKSEAEALIAAKQVGYPLLMRPSFVLGGRAMRIVYSDEEVKTYLKEAVEVSVERPVLMDRFLEDAIEVDVDCISDGKTTVIGAVMQHIEQAGVHSGDSACVIPAFSLSEKALENIRRATREMALELKVKGLMNVQFAVKDNEVYVLEVNPRASRTVPFVSKAIGVPLAKLAAKVMAGESLKSLKFTQEIIPKHFSVKEAVFPFSKFKQVDILLGPEMKSTGEVMGMDDNLGIAYAKSQMAAQPALPSKGKVFFSINAKDELQIKNLAQKLLELGFSLCAHDQTADFFEKHQIPFQRLSQNKGQWDVLELLNRGEISLIINTPGIAEKKHEEIKFRTLAYHRKVPVMTTLPGAQAAVNGIAELKISDFTVKSLQEYHANFISCAA